jgi:hypothetical protein
MKKKIWKRKCPNPDNNPNCKEEISYTRKDNRDKAEKENWKCCSCANSGKKKPDISGENNPAKRPEVRKKISEAKIGIKFTDRHKKNISESKKGIPRSEETKRKISENNGSRRPEVRKKQRISAIKRIEKTNGQIMPNSNPKAT